MASGDVHYVTYDQFLEAAAQELGTPASMIRGIANRNLAESALYAPRSGYGGVEQYPDLAEKIAILLWRLAANHPLPDGNKRVATLCAIIFANLNGYDWEPPSRDEPDGDETVEVVEAAAQGHIPLGALTAWVAERLVYVPLTTDTPDNTMIRYPAELVGMMPYENDTIMLGDIVIRDVHGYNPAAVYVRRVSGKVENISVAEIVISVVGDAYAQEELDAENAEADRYPLGPKEYWRTKLVGRATYADGHTMTDEEFEEEWDG